MSEQMYNILGTKEPDNLIAGNEITPIVKGLTLAKNQGVLARGTVVGKITASGLCVPVDDQKTDGSETPHCILTDTVDTGDGAALIDYDTTGYFSGVFNQDKLVFGGDDTFADHEAKLREVGIFLKEMK